MLCVYVSVCVKMDNSLDSEIICSQTSVVDLQNETAVLHCGIKYLRTNQEVNFFYQSTKHQQISPLL